MVDLNRLRLWVQTVIDVYKRQEYIKETGKITDAEGKLLSDDELLNKANNYKAFVDELDKRADVKAVSYTHLDVYKRQQL